MTPRRVGYRCRRCKRHWLCGKENGGHKWRCCVDGRGYPCGGPDARCERPEWFTTSLRRDHPDHKPTRAAERMIRTALLRMFTG
jgi:hypothetical protein